ncbi:toxin-activating lysine-acyltransferase [Luteibacter sp. CQ10]|uniref:toxin-activating lysine-acyltransferase n=1 Tax=Luteibacter sp. CQ10 TaxID=2805821 RepID=UPI0034A54E97
MNAHYTQLGKLVSVMAKNDAYCQYPVACISLWLEPAVYVEQAHFFEDINGLVVGYVTWAWLTAEAEHRLLNDRDVIFHLSEWNEGDRLWFLDFVVLNGDVKGCIREAMALFPSGQSARSLRRTEAGEVRSLTSWRKR